MTVAMIDWLRRAMARGEPGLPATPAGLWAFWPYDRFPYLLSGEVVEQLPDGRVKVKGYTGMVFTPVYMASGAAGERMSREVRRVSAAYRIHEECARNGAGTAAYRHLELAGLPPGALGKLKRTGWQGSAYEELFEQQIKQERVV